MEGIIHNRGHQVLANADDITFITSSKHELIRAFKKLRKPEYFCNHRFERTQYPPKMKDSNTIAITYFAEVY